MFQCADTMVCKTFGGDWSEMGIQLEIPQSSVLEIGATAPEAYYYPPPPPDYWGRLSPAPPLPAPMIGRGSKTETKESLSKLEGYIC